MHMTNRSGQQHVGTGSRNPGRDHNRRVDYELTGTIRWLDVDLERVVLAVEHTGGHAGRFLGRDVTIDLEIARLHRVSLDALLPGERVRVRARLARDLGSVLPHMVQALSVERVG